MYGGEKYREGFGGGKLKARPLRRPRRKWRIYLNGS